MTARLLAVVTLCVAGVCAEATAYAATSAGRRDSLRGYLDGLAAFGFTGQVVVGEGDSILAEIAAGRADSSGAPVTPRTCFAAGSIAKNFTAVMIVRLAQRGVLALDDSLAARLPAVPADKRGITLRQLLTHTSGLAENGDDVGEEDPRDVVVAKVLATPPVAEPGARFSYSNAGFELLAAVIERTTGRAHADVVRAELLDPAGMSGSGTGAAAAARCAEAADGRNEWRFLGTLRGWRQVWAGTGAGDMVTNARDLTRWARVLQGNGPLSSAELDTLLASRVPIGRNLTYGFGAYVVPRPGGVAMVSIGGDVPGYHAAMWIERQPPWRVTTVVMSGEHFGRSLAVSAVQRALWGILDDEPAMVPPATVPWPFAAAGAIAGEWTLPGGARLELTPDGGGLRLGLSGVMAMDLAYGPDTSETRALIETRTEQILRAAAMPHEAVLGDALHSIEYELWARALRAAMAERTGRLGNLRGVTVTGTVPLPWLERGRRTYVTLRFARGEADASLAWLDQGLLDVSFGEGRPHPVLLPVAPLADGGLAAWSVLDGRVVHLEPFRDRRGPAILVTGPGGRAIARRPKK